jgi:hypothetical protein
MTCDRATWSAEVRNRSNSSFGRIRTHPASRRNPDNPSVAPATEHRGDLAGAIVKTNPESPRVSGSAPTTGPVPVQRVVPAVSISRFNRRSNPGGCARSDRPGEPDIRVNDASNILFYKGFLLFKIFPRLHPRWHEATHSGSSPIQLLCRLAVAGALGEHRMPQALGLTLIFALGTKGGEVAACPVPVDALIDTAKLVGLLER